MDRSSGSAYFVWPEALRKVFWLSGGVAAAVHLALLISATQLVRITRLLEEAKPATVKFHIQRDPRIAKPFEMRKKPQPRERKMMRQEVEVQARTSQLVSSRAGSLSLRTLSAPPVQLEGGAKLVSIDLGARARDLGVATSKEPENKIEMREQLLDLNFLDTGKYQAMVVQDPANKRNIQGYFHIAQAYSARMVEYNIQAYIRSGDSGFEMLQNPHAVQNVVNALNEYTNIHADFSARLPLSSKELLETPWVFVPAVQFTLTEGELENLGRYLVAGGFLLLDAGSVGGDVDAFFRQMVIDALDRVGREARFFRLPNDHPIYHAYFDFDRPPRALLGGAGIGGRIAGEGRDNVDYMVGVEVDGRLAVAFSYQSLGIAWENIGFRNQKSLYSDNSRHLQFGINTIVFALTQEGSITNRVMQTVR